MARTKQVAKKTLGPQGCKQLATKRQLAGKNKIKPETAPPPVVVYNGVFKGVELSCVMGDVSESDLDAIVVSCDPEFQLTEGLVKTVAQAAGAEFSTDVTEATGGANIEVVSVVAPETLKSEYVILVPLHNEIHKACLDSAYSIAFQEAAQLGISSLCVPPIGSGEPLNICLADVADFVVQALQSCSNFGALKKIQFIDSNYFSMNTFKDALEKLTTGEIVQPLMASVNAAVPGCSKTSEPDVYWDCLSDLDAGETAPMIGDQPIGSEMTIMQIPGSVPGHPDAKGWHVINYMIPGGSQPAEPLRPGVSFTGTNRTAYLPNNAAGTEVLKLLRIAFDRRLIFTVTSAEKNIVTWNCIQHKTSMTGGRESFGYPDADYLDHVREELSAVGVHKDMLEDD